MRTKNRDKMTMIINVLTQSFSHASDMSPIGTIPDKNITNVPIKKKIILYCCSFCAKVTNLSNFSSIRILH